MMADQMDLKAVWDKTADQVKQKVIHPTLWRTLELAVPITISDGQFVVGFPAADFHLSGNLTTAQHKNAIESAIRQYTGLDLRIRVIDGTTVQDWQNVVDKESSALDLHDQERKKRESEAAIAHSWDGLFEHIGRAYATLPYRQFPQARAAYIQDMIVEISEAMDDLMVGTHTELSERSLARAIDRVGTLTESPGAMIAFELRRYRASLGK